MMIEDLTATKEIDMSAVHGGAIDGKCDDTSLKKVTMDYALEGRRP